MINDPIPALKEQLRRSILTEIGLMDKLGAACMLGVDEARMSNLLHKRLDRFSLQRLHPSPGANQPPSGPIGCRCSSVAETSH